MASIDQQIIAMTRTAYGVAVQSMKYLGLPFTLTPNTTLNERLNIQPGVLPGAGQMPNLRYLTIGNMGHDAVKEDDGSWASVPRRQKPQHSGMYGQIPFALRETDNDLPATLRAKMALRRIEVHNGRNYIAYYAMRIPVDTVTVQLQKIEKINGVITVTPYVPTTDDLNPKPPTIDNSGTVLGSDSSVSASAILTVELTAEIIAEIINAHKIRTGSTYSPVISELGLCTGVDKEVTGQSGSSGSFRYNEVIACQINMHVATNHPVGYTSDGATLNLDVGGVEPLLAEASSGSVTWL